MAASNNAGGKARSFPLIKNLFNVKKFFPKNIEQKKSGAFPSYFFQSYISTPGKPVWMSRDYEKFSDEGFQKNVIAYRSISMVAGAVSSVPFMLYEKATGKEIKNHKILELLKKPNPSMNGVEFIESLIAYKLISGNSFIQMVKDFNEEVKELYLLRPDRVSIITGRNYMPAAYRYNVDGAARDFSINRINGKSDILHIKNFHPLSDWHGLSPLEAAAYAIDQHNAAASWNQALLQNGARPTGALIVKADNNGRGGNLSESEYQRLKSEIDEKFSGSSNAGRPLLLEGGLEWKEMSMSPKDMDFLECKYSSARDIALAFGVPPQLLGIPGDNTYSNLAEARIALWEQTVLPMLDKIVGALNNWLIPNFDANLRLDYDTDEISALTEKRQKTFDKLQNVTFLTLNEKRRMAGFSEIEGGNNL